MAREVLSMKPETVNKLKNIIVDKRFVNAYSREFSPENKMELEQFLSKLKETYKSEYVGIDIQALEDCETEAHETKLLLELINRELAGQGIKTFQTQSFSIAAALSRWSEHLDRKVLLVFHCFHDRYSEKEKNILRALRKTLTNTDEISSYLGILIISTRPVYTWELFPESNLDERHVVFAEFQSSAET